MKSPRLALLVALAACFSPAIAVAQFKTTPLPPSAVTQFRTKLSPSLIPHLDGNFKLDPGQSFVVQGDGFASFMLFPTRFEAFSEDAPSSTSHCGVFFISGQDASISFLGTLGFANREPELCDDLLGVGFMTMPSGPPRIILLYDGGSFNYSGKDPVILDWNPATRRYASNDKIVDKLKNRSTIPAIKTQLKAMNP